MVFVNIEKKAYENSKRKNIYLVGNRQLLTYIMAPLSGSEFVTFTVPHPTVSLPTVSLPTAIWT